MGYGEYISHLTNKENIPMNTLAARLTPLANPLYIRLFLIGLTILASLIAPTAVHADPGGGTVGG